MDFLVLFSRGRRVVIELDGKQHYAVDGRAEPRLYAEMVKEDRALRLAAYDVYRIGGYELLDSARGRDMLGEFFHRLFDRYDVALGKTEESAMR